VFLFTSNPSFAESPLTSTLQLLHSYLSTASENGTLFLFLVFGIWYCDFETLSFVLIPDFNVICVFVHGNRPSEPRRPVLLENTVRVRFRLLLIVFSV